MKDWAIPGRFQTRQYHYEFFKKSVFTIPLMLTRSWRKTVDSYWEKYGKTWSNFESMNIVTHFLKKKMMMSCFCGVVDQQKAFSVTSSQDHCQRSSPSQISDTLLAGFEPAQNLSSGFNECS